MSNNQPVSIEKNLQYPKSMDFSALKNEGIDIAQQLSGDIWTDYNVHDPGVTILEQLCYALTELGYKASLDIERLLFSKSDKTLDLSQTAMYDPSEVLPTAPFTPDDYRKLILDHLYLEIKNAWVLPKG
ncbi:MAG: hypothetical protein AAFO07_24915, partial [Bacteroidota bacterium]